VFNGTAHEDRSVEDRSVVNAVQEGGGCQLTCQEGGESKGDDGAGEADDGCGLEVVCKHAGVQLQPHQVHEQHQAEGGGGRDDGQG